MTSLRKEVLLNATSRTAHTSQPGPALIVGLTSKLQGKKCALGGSPSRLSSFQR